MICFGRGDDAATRDRKDGLRRLIIRISDPLMEKLEQLLREHHDSVTEVARRLRKDRRQI